jgi:hypothetical protein
MLRMVVPRCLWVVAMMKRVAASPVSVGPGG